MYQLNEWIKSALVGACRTGEFSRHYVALKAADFLAKGILNQADLEEVYLQTEPGEEEPEEEEEEQ